MRPICEISPNLPLDCLRIIHKKIQGHELLQKEFRRIIDAIYCDRLSDVHIAAFLTACAAKHLLENEIIHLTQAMIDVGDAIQWDKKQIIVDKHCIGGLAGNRTTPLIVSIVACTGLFIPKSSSQSITSPSGTADTMAVLTNVSLSTTTIKDVVLKTGGCLVWGGKANMSPVDDLIIQIERTLDLDYDGQLIASILSKKIAAGAQHILIDIPVGPQVKIKNRHHAKQLIQHFEIVARSFGVNVKCIVTDGRSPIGNGVGPALEARDILQVLKNEPGAPLTLKQKACHMANLIFKMAHLPNQAEEILASGQAWQKFQEICNAQGKSVQQVPTAMLQHTITSPSSGVVKGIRNKHIIDGAKMAGAPLHAEAGLYLHAHVGDRIRKGQPLLTIHARDESKLNLALQYFQLSLPYTIGG